MVHGIGHKFRSAVLALAFLTLASPPAWSADSTPKQPEATPAAADGVPPVDARPERIAELIEQLGDSKYAVRERAQADLLRIGPPALDALTKALEHNDVEIAMRARYLLGSIKVEWTRDSDPPRLRALLKDYDELDEEAREDKILDLGKTAGETEIEILSRIVRYERAQRLSKKAALLIIELPAPKTDEEWKKRTDLVAATLGTTHRTSADWVRSALKHRTVTPEAVEAWKRLVEAEQQTLKNSSSMTRPDVVGALLRHEVEMLEQLGRQEEAQEVMRGLVPLERGDAKSVSSLVHWLARKKAWKVIDDVAARFGTTFDQDPMLLYTLAEARLAQGKEALADQIAAKAMALSGDDIERHASIVEQLQKQGMYRWAEKEYRRIIAIGPPGSAPAAYRLLSEMLHDQGKEEEAGQALQSLVEQLNTQPELAQLLQQTAGSIRSRMYYFQAEHERLKGNIARQTELLDKAIGQDATDADVLTALYRLPNQTPERRQETTRKIKTAADAFRREIRESPDSVSGYNQLAWLLGNTLGETDPAVADEAIRSSLKSLELVPRSAGYLDTLARCYYAKGDYEAAVRHQSEAVAMEPHSGLIRRQLQLFEKALAESKKKGTAPPSKPADAEKSKPAG